LPCEITSRNQYLAVGYQSGGVTEARGIEAGRFREIFHIPEPPNAEKPRGGLSREALEEIEKAAKLL
jgi:hypothetical protein